MDKSTVVLMDSQVIWLEQMKLQVDWNQSSSLQGNSRHILLVNALLSVNWIQSQSQSQIAEGDTLSPCQYQKGMFTVNSDKFY